MKKIFQFIVSLLLCLLVFSSLKSSNIVLAANTHNDIPVAKYKNVNLNFQTTEKNIVISARSSKKQNLKFNLVAGSREYLIDPHLKKYNFKRKASYHINTQITQALDKSQRKVLLKSGTYRRLALKKKKYVYMVDLIIPIKSLDPNLSQSAIMKLTPILTKQQKISITSIGLSTFPIIPVIISILIVLWIYILSVLKRAEIHGLYFWAASISTFVILAFFFHDPISYWMARFVSWIMSYIGDTTHLFNSIVSQNLMYLFSHNNLVQISIDYECSGMLELLVYMSLLIFYPVFSPIEKIARAIEGFLWITGANILRIMLIVLSVKYIGVDGISITHLVISRVVFYMLTIILYYNVFTKSQIIKGWRRK